MEISKGRSWPHTIWTCTDFKKWRAWWETNLHKVGTHDVLWPEKSGEILENLFGRVKPWFLERYINTHTKSLRFHGSWPANMDLEPEFTCLWKRTQQRQVQNPLRTANRQCRFQKYTKFYQVWFFPWNHKIHKEITILNSNDRTRCTNIYMLELLKMDYKISVNTFKGINKKLKKKSHSKYLCSKYIPDTVTGTLLRLNP